LLILQRANTNECPVPGTLAIRQIVINQNYFKLWSIDTNGGTSHVENHVVCSWLDIVGKLSVSHPAKGTTSKEEMALIFYV
jgi:hypothetical protein